MYDKNHYNIVISLQLIKINEKKSETTFKIALHTEHLQFPKQWKEEIKQ